MSTQLGPLEILGAAAVASLASAVSACMYRVDVTLPSSGWKRNNSTGFLLP